MSDLAVTAQGVDLAGDPVARSLAVAGFGMFALLHPGPLEHVLSLPEAVARAQAASETAAPVPMAGPAGAATVAGELSGVEGTPLLPVESGDAHPALPEPPVEQVPATRSTLAMLNEISFLDE